jgi:hypothetical protein
LLSLLHALAKQVLDDRGTLVAELFGGLAVGKSSLVKVGCFVLCFAAVQLFDGYC